MADAAISYLACGFTAGFITSIIPSYDMKFIPSFFQLSHYRFHPIKELPDKAKFCILGFAIKCNERNYNGVSRPINERENIIGLHGQTHLIMGNPDIL